MRFAQTSIATIVALATGVLVGYHLQWADDNDNLTSRHVAERAASVGVVTNALWAIREEEREQGAAVLEIWLDGALVDIWASRDDLAEADQRRVAEMVLVARSYRQEFPRNQEVVVSEKVQQLFQWAQKYSSTDER